jgi:hypothetical protein
MTRDFTPVHERLKRVLEPYRGAFHVARDDPDGMVLEVRGMEGTPTGFAAGTRVGKRYVSIYLMPVYAEPRLLDDASAALLRRKQGKSCFNFATIDEPLMKELEAIVAVGLPRYEEWARAIVNVDLGAIQTRLAAVLSAARGRFTYADDGGRPRLEVPGLEGNPQGAVAQIAIRRRYVAYTLVPFYLLPELLDGTSAELRRTFNGKGIFRFSSADEPLMVELQALTERAVEAYRPIADRKLAEAAERRR